MKTASFLPRSQLEKDTPVSFFIPCVLFGSNEPVRTRQQYRLASAEMSAFCQHFAVFLQ